MPQDLRVFVITKKGTRLEITPDVLDTYGTLYADVHYVVELTPAAGGELTQVKVQWIHIRDTFTQFALDKVFNAFAATGKDPVITRKNPKILVVDYATPQKTAVEITFTATDAVNLAKSGLEAHHSYLWPLLHMTGTGLADVQFDVKTRGIGYFG